MKILLIHNFYGSSAPSGENTVFKAELDLLRENGHTVIEFTRNSDDVRNQGSLGLLKGALSTPWNPFSLRKLRNILEIEKPEIMHVHNFFPLLSPSIFYAAKTLDTAIVFTLHNYRLFCASGMTLRDNSPCTECLDLRCIIPSLKHKCYRESRLATFPLATMISMHRRLNTWKKKVNAFIALTEFQKITFIQAGLPAEHIFTKPNFYANPPSPISWDNREPKVVYIGRLSPEKGVNILLESWRMWGEEAPALEIIGDGPDRYHLEQFAAGNNLESKVNFRGQLSFLETQNELAKARLLILPTLWYEGLPMTVLEAFAMGVPVMASRLGSLPYIVEDDSNGILFTPGNSDDLYHKAKRLWKNFEELYNLSIAARNTFEKKYSANANYQILMNIYQAAMNDKKSRLHEYHDHF